MGYLVPSLHHSALQPSGHDQKRNLSRKLFVRHASQGYSSTNVKIDNYRDSKFPGGPSNSYWGVKTVANSLLKCAEHTIPNTKYLPLNSYLCIFRIYGMVAPCCWKGFTKTYSTNHFSNMSWYVRKTGKQM